MDALSLLNQIKSSVYKRQETIEGKIQELELKVAKLKEQLQKEFDAQVSAEVEGKVYNDNLVKKINADLIELDGCIAAYNRQLEKVGATEDEQKEILKLAAQEYKAESIQKQRNQVRMEKINNEIEKLMKEGKDLDSATDFLPHRSKLRSIAGSGLFPGWTEESVGGKVSTLADVHNDPEFKSLVEEYKKLREGKRFDKYFWNERR